MEVKSVSWGYSKCVTLTVLNRHRVSAVINSSMDRYIAEVKRELNGSSFTSKTNKFEKGLKKLLQVS